MFRLLVIVHAMLNRWLFGRVANDYQDRNTANTYQSEATGRLGWGLIQYLAEYEETWGGETMRRCSELRLGWLAIGIGTEAGDIPCFGSFIALVVWKYALVLEFGHETKVGLAIAD